MIGTDLKIKPVTCGLPAKQFQPSAVKLVEIHVGIIISETTKYSVFSEKDPMFHMFDEVFPYIWIHLMDVQKVSTKTRVETHSSWQIHG